MIVFGYCDWYELLVGRRGFDSLFVEYNDNVLSVYLFWEKYCLSWLEFIGMLLLKGFLFWKNDINDICSEGSEFKIIVMILNIVIRHGDWCAFFVRNNGVRFSVCQLGW